MEPGEVRFEAPLVFFGFSVSMGVGTPYLLRLSHLILYLGGSEN